MARVEVTRRASEAEWRKGSIVPRTIRVRGGIALGIAVCVAASIVATAAATSSLQTATRYTLKATLNTKNEIPAPKSAHGATGLLTGRLTLDGKRSRLTWRLKFSHLTGRAVSAELHFGRAGKTGGVAFTLCHPCLVGASGAYKGAYLASPTFRKPLLHGGIYAIVRTKLNPKGEIRGQVKATAA
jgi:hypothetical protein